MNENLHVVPVNDLIDHDDYDDCPCGPAPKAVKRDDGSVGWVVVHNSLDGRETHEKEEGDGPSEVAEMVQHVRCGSRRTVQGRQRR